MKKIFEPLKIEIYYYEEKDIVTFSAESTDDNELPGIIVGSIFHV